MAEPTTPWQDRFNTPDVKTLRTSLTVEVRETFDRIRDFLSAIDEIEERPVWMGTNWCWSIGYFRGDDELPLAILVPAPEDLQLAMPITHEFVGELPIRRMKRAVRDGLELAQEPYHTNWGVWSLNPTHVLEDLEDLVNRRVKYDNAHRVD